MTPPNDSNPESIRRYLSEIDKLEFGDAKVSAAELAVRLADSSKDNQLRYDARSELVTCAIFSGRPDIALVHFSWMLSRFDAQPEGIDETSFLWRYRWTLAQVLGFPQIPKDRILSMLEDLETRFERYGHGRQTVQMLRYRVHKELGNKSLANKAYREMKKTPLDSFSDCEACVCHREVGRLSYKGSFESAIKAAEPIMNGKLSCFSVPHETFGTLLFPLLRMNRGEEAMALHKRGYRLAEKNPTFINTAGEHMAFLALTGNQSGALKLFTRHAPVAAVARDVADEFGFNQSAYLTLLLLADAGKESLQLRLPKEFPVSETHGIYQTQVLIDWYRTRLTDVAKLFDARNGNEERIKLVRRVPRLKRFATVIPLQKKRS